jgi:hypothetical protein
MQKVTHYRASTAPRSHTPLCHGRSVLDLGDLTMMQNILPFVAFWLMQKLADAVVDKALEKALSDEYLKRLIIFLKLQFLVFYLAGQLRATPKARTARSRSWVQQSESRSATRQILATEEHSGLSLS